MTKKSSIIDGIDFTGLRSSGTTSLNQIHPITGMPTGIIFTGHTYDSKEWKQAERKINGVAKNQVLKLDKKGSSIELDKDASTKKRKLVIAVITEVRQVSKDESVADAVVSDSEKIKVMLSDPELEWMLEDWTDHLDDRSNFFPK